MTFFQDFLSLISGAFAIFLAKERAAFAVVFVGAVGLAVLCWLGCSVYSRLWNKRYRVRPVHHVLCGLAALITLLAAMVFAPLKHAAAAAGVSIEAWKIQLKLDRLWADQTFKQAYERVRDLGMEDFSNAPPPPMGRTIPATNEESKLKCASVYANQAARHFLTNRPYLGRIAGASSEIPQDVLLDDMHRHFASVGNNYPADKAISLVGDEVRRDLETKLPRVVYSLRLQLVTLFLLFQAIPFGLVGWAAYRDLKVRV